jgi:hypothetical protein
MSNKNAQALTLIRSVGSTPGYAMEPQERGRYKLIRLAVDRYDVKEASVTVSANSADRQHENDVARVKRKLGWTPELFETTEDIARRHRIAETDPAEDILKALLTAWDIDPEAAQGAPARNGHQPARKRHGKGGTVTGSARVAAGEAQPGEAPVVVEAPVQVLDNVGRMQPEMISPERALDLLTRLAPHLGEPDPQKVEEYAAVMRRPGAWALDPAHPVCIDTDGHTAKGLHRLHACVEAEVPFPAWVAYDTPPGAPSAIGAPVPLPQAAPAPAVAAPAPAPRAAEANPRDLTSAARFAYLWFNVPQDEWKGAPEITGAQVQAIIEAHPQLRGSVKDGRLAKLKISRQATALAHYLISQTMDGDARPATAWFRAIQAMDLDRGDPGHTLALYYLQGTSERMAVLNPRPKRDLDMYLLLTAWNDTCLGKEVRSISWDLDFTIPAPIAPPRTPATGKALHTFPAIH